MYTPDPLPPEYPDETEREAFKLYLKATNFRPASRILSVNHQSIINWIINPLRRYSVLA